MDSNSKNTIAHLQMAQDVITRMAGNSAQMKTWTVSLVTAAFVFSGLSDNPHWLIGVGGYVPILAFWFMDAGYLRLERCYIKLYDAVAGGEAVKPFDLNYRPYADSVDSVWAIAWSWSVRWFYGALLILMTALVAILLSLGSPHDTAGFLQFPL